MMLAGDHLVDLVMGRRTQEDGQKTNVLLCRIGNRLWKDLSLSVAYSVGV